MKRLDPLHLVGVAAWAHHAQENGSWLDLHDIESASAGYAARMGLGQVVNEHAGRHCLPPMGGVNDQRHSLLEVSRIGSGSDAARWAGLVRSRAADTAPEDALNALHEGLAEIGENVSLHSGTYGFVAAQTFAQTGLIRFAVADAGRGLRSTLRERGATSDQHALTMALDGVSRLEGAHGFGVHTTWDLIRSLGGSMVLASNSAALLRTASVRGEQRARVEFPGTIFEGCIPAAALLSPTSGRRRDGSALFRATGRPEWPRERR